MPRKPRKPKKDVPPPPPSDADKERPEFYAAHVTLLYCTPGNYDHPEGEPASIVTISRGTGIEALVIDMRDTRTLVTKLMVSLATYNDELAQKLLDDHFAHDQEGEFIWPAGSDES